MRQRGKEAIYALATVLGIFLAWEIIVDLLRISSVILPAPSEIYYQGFLPYFQILPQATLVTLYETIAGFALSVVFGLLLAVVIYHSHFLSTAIYPVIISTQTLPKVALAPLLLVWFGLGLTSKIVLVFLIAFFPILVDTLAGFRDTPKEILDLANAWHVGPVKKLRLLIFPWALPHIFSGLKVSITLAVVGAIIAEFVQSNQGLGFIITQAQFTLSTPLMFAGILLTGALGLAMYGVILMAEKFVIPWYGQMRQRI